MKVETIVKNFIDFNSDAEFSSQNKLDNTKILPFYMRDTIEVLEEELYSNKSFFLHILTKLAASGFKWRFNSDNSTYSIQTSKGEIILM